MTTGRAWALWLEGRPLTTNRERKLTPYARARAVAEIREAAGWTAKAAGIPVLERVEVVAVPHVRNRRSLPDVAAQMPTAKAVIDALVDVQVLGGDGPDRVVRLTFEAPVVDGRDGLEVVVVDVGDGAELCDASVTPLCVCGAALDGLRSDARHCSARCRQRAYRERLEAVR